MSGDVTRLRRPDYLEQTLELEPLRHRKVARRAPGQRRIVFEKNFAEKWYAAIEAIRQGRG